MTRQDKKIIIKTLGNVPVKNLKLKSKSVLMIPKISSLGKCFGSGSQILSSSSKTWRNLVVGDLSRKVPTIFQAESIVFVNCCVCPFCQVAFSCFARSSAFASFPSIIAKVKREAISRFSGWASFMCVTAFALAITRLSERSCRYIIPPKCVSGWYLM